MQGPDEVRIETPEQIDLALEPAGLGSRFYAWFMDCLLWAALLILVGVAGAVLLGLAGASPSAEWFQGLAGALWGAIVYAAWVLYGVAFELRSNGQTPGKAFAGIRVLREGGAPVDFRSSCIRNLLRLVDFMPMFYLLGGLMVLLTNRKQRLGDLAAGTMVIRERALAAPADLARLIQKFASEEFLFTPEQVRACTPNDRYILRSYFLRLEEMEPDARRKLAQRLAATFYAKTGYEPNRPQSDAGLAETFLASLYRDLDNWARHGRK